MGILKDRIQTKITATSSKNSLRSPYREIVKNISNLVNMFGCTDLNRFWTISWSGKHGSLFRLLRCDRGYNEAVLNQVLSNNLNFLFCSDVQMAKHPTKNLIFRFLFYISNSPIITISLIENGIFDVFTTPYSLRPHL